MDIDFYQLSHEEILRLLKEEKIRMADIPEELKTRQFYMDAASYLLNESLEQDLIYLIHMGQIDIQDVPEHYRTCDVCLESYGIDPSSYDYFPEDVKEELDERGEVEYRETPPEPPKEEEKPKRGFLSIDL